MSFKVEITGHSPSDHAQEVKEIAVRATRELLALGGSASLSGYAIDSKLSFDLNDGDVADVVALEDAAKAQAEAPAASDPTKLAKGEAWDATDAALKKAKELKVDLGTVAGTGLGETVTVADVEKASKK